MRHKSTHEQPIGLFVTGLYRSGTTLLDKLLNAHPEVCLASQPMAPLFQAPKSALHSSVGRTRRYPLDHLFLEDAYRRSELDAFLTNYRFAAETLRSVLDSSRNANREFWTDEIQRAALHLSAKDFGSVVRRWLELPSIRYNRPDARYSGCKEIVCEEYIPFLLGIGVRVILVIRDPRDVITSSNFGRGREFTGRIRPTLFTVRAWRKSVAFWLACADHPGFLGVRHEDLTASPLAELDRITAFLGLSSFPRDMLSESMTDQNGAPWVGNSSFQTLDGVLPTQGSHIDRLPREAAAYIENCCQPEMSILGYDETKPFDERPIRDYVEPFAVDHDLFDQGYSSRKDHQDQETRRHHLLQPDVEPLTDAEAERWFIHTVTYERLRAALQASFHGTTHEPVSENER